MTVTGSERHRRGEVAAGIIMRPPRASKASRNPTLDKRGVKIVRWRFVEVAELRRVSAERDDHSPIAPILTDRKGDLAAAPAATASSSAQRGRGTRRRPARPRRRRSLDIKCERRACREDATEDGSWPLVALASLLSLAMGLALTVWRRYAVDRCSVPRAALVQRRGPLRYDDAMNNPSFSSVSSGYRSELRSVWGWRWSSVGVSPGRPGASSRPRR